jgi:hypothetical protein
VRALFFLLLSANLVIAALVFTGSGDVPRGDAYVAEPLNPDRIRLLGTTGAGAVAPASGAKPAACLEWGPFRSGEVAAAEGAIGRLGLGQRLEARQVAVEDDSGYWVYIPPLKSRQEAEQKIAELKRLGVSDYFLVQGDGKWKHAISLGMFRTEEAAKAHLDTLGRKGVKPALSGKRERPVTLTVFVARDADDALAAALAELRQSFPETELKAVVCAEPDEG